MLLHIIITIVSMLCGMILITTGKKETGDHMSFPDMKEIIGLFLVCFGLLYFVISLLIHLL